MQYLLTLCLICFFCYSIHPASVEDTPTLEGVKVPRIRHKLQGLDTVDCRTVVLLSALLGPGADVESTDSLRRMPIHVACEARCP